MKWERLVEEKEYLQKFQKEGDALKFFEVLKDVV